MPELNHRFFLIAALALAACQQESTDGRSAAEQGAPAAPIRQASASTSAAPDETRSDPSPGIISGPKAEPGPAGESGASPAMSESAQAPAPAALGNARGLPCAVAETLDKYCASCHAGAHDHQNAPHLGAAADFRATNQAGEAYHQIARRKLNAADPHQTMPPAGYPKPDANELMVLNAWLERGAPDSQETCAKTAPAQIDDEDDDDTSGLTCYPLLAHSGDLRTPYKVGIAHDAYIAFTFQPPWKSVEYGMVVRTVVDQAQAVHHVILFEDQTPATPGVSESTVVHPNSLMIAGWTPGNPNMDFRKMSGEDVGLELRTDRTYTVELHYNSEDPELSDRSGMEVCTRKEAPKNVASYAWVGIDNFLEPSAKWLGTCRPTATEPIRLLSIMPHMHLTGIHFRATLNRLNGEQVVLHDQPFDFRFERQYPVNLTLYPGESITTECTYSEPKTYGPNVQDEMCTLFTMHYPKGTLVNDGLWSLVHGGGACLDN